MLLACPQKLLDVAWLLGAWLASTYQHGPCTGHAVLKWQLRMRVSLGTRRSWWYLGHACGEESAWLSGSMS